MGRPRASTAHQLAALLYPIANPKPVHFGSGQSNMRPATSCTAALQVGKLVRASPHATHPTCCVVQRDISIAVGKMPALCQHLSSTQGPAWPSLQHMCTTHQLRRQGCSPDARGRASMAARTGSRCSMQLAHSGAPNPQGFASRHHMPCGAAGRGGWGRPQVWVHPAKAR